MAVIKTGCAVGCSAGSAFSSQKVFQHGQ
jgi:hypothetical protein